jgi:REP element-mobilizing transposase RayT
MGHPPRIPALLGLNQSVIYFVTFCVEGRRHVLDNNDAFAAFRQAIVRVDWHIIAAVLMPDHVHLLAGPHDRDVAVGSLYAAMKRGIRKRLNARLAMATWLFRSLATARRIGGGKMGIH